MFCSRVGSFTEHGTSLQVFGSYEENSFGSVAMQDTASRFWMYVSPFDSTDLQDWHALYLAVVGSSAYLCLVLSSGESRYCPSSGEDHEGVSRHAPKLKSKSPKEEHDEDAVGPLKNGRGMLQDEALLAEEDSTWWSEIKENNRSQQELHQIFDPFQLMGCKTFVFSSRGRCNSSCIQL